MPFVASSLLAHRTSAALPRVLAATYALLIVYACLHPLNGWRDVGLPLFDFLRAPWPAYWRVQDLLFNIFGYLPFGFLLVAALPQQWSVLRRVAFALVLASSLSLGLETLQNFLPTRVSSNVDLACNALGALLGAILGVWFGQALLGAGGALPRWRREAIPPGIFGDLALALMLLWLFSLLSPAMLLFGGGDLRGLLDLPPPLPFEAGRFLRMEAALTVSATLGAGLYFASLHVRRAPLAVLVLIVAGLVVKTLAGAVFFVAPEPWIWITPGTRLGLLIGLPALLILALLPRALLHPLAALGLLMATVLVNLMPENPYLLHNPPPLKSGNFLTFQGVTGIVASAWPFLALVHLSFSGARR